MMRSDGAEVPFNQGQVAPCLGPRALIDGASFGPDALKVIGQAFDLAWAEIGSNFAADPVVN
jgi:hypothetical protein